MVISGNFLPVSYTGNDSQSSNLTQNSTGQKNSFQPHREQHNEPVEYVFQGEVLDETTNSGREKRTYQQQIDPANRTAITSYADTDSISLHQRSAQGLLVDIYI